MKKTIIITALCGFAMLGVTSCNTWLGTAVQQIAGMVDIETTTMSIVYQAIEKHPDSIDLFNKISEDLVKLSEKDKLTLGDVEEDVKKRIDDSNLPFKNEIKDAVEKVFRRISTDKEFDIAAHKAEILEVASGIDWAIKDYSERNSKMIPSEVTK